MRFSSLLSVALLLVLFSCFLLTQVHSHLPKKYVRPRSRRSGVKTHYFSMSDLEEPSLAQMFGPRRVAPSTDAYLSDVGSKFRKLVDDFEFRVQYGLSESGHSLQLSRVIGLAPCVRQSADRHRLVGQDKVHVRPRQTEQESRCAGGQ